VLGLGSQLKRSVGRLQLRDEMRKQLEGVRLSFRAVPPPPQSSLNWPCLDDAVDAIYHMTTFMVR
jgi:hypothetical protein